MCEHVNVLDVRNRSPTSLRNALFYYPSGRLSNYEELLFSIYRMASLPLKTDFSDSVTYSYEPTCFSMNMRKRAKQS